VSDNQSSYQTAAAPGRKSRVRGHSSSCVGLLLALQPAAAGKNPGVIACPALGVQQRVFWWTLQLLVLQRTSPAGVKRTFPTLKSAFSFKNRFQNKINKCCCVCLLCFLFPFPHPPFFIVNFYSLAEATVQTQSAASPQDLPRLLTCTDCGPTLVRPLMLTS